MMTCKPVIKYVGGKRQLADAILARIDKLCPYGIDHYYEPFVGGGAIFFALAARNMFKAATISDTNAELINLYVCVRDDVGGVVAALKKLIKIGTTEKAYYEIRAARPRSGRARAARTIYLNKTGFNGLYRVNKKGEFNVPWGKRKNPVVLDEETLRAAAEALQGVEIRVADFGWSMGHVGPGDFIYMDPPYIPASKSADFTAYQAAGFGVLEQERLALWLKLFAQNGVPFLLSNSDTPLTRKIYKGFKVTKVLARRNINSVGSKRGAVGELLIERK